MDITEPNCWIFVYRIAAQYLSFWNENSTSEGKRLQAAFDRATIVNAQSES